MKKLFITLVAVAALTLVGAPSAQANGSDSPPPYDVTQYGVTLPDGATFQAHGHVNVKYTDYEGGNPRSAGIHFDPNNGHPGGQWIGEQFIPWSAFGLSNDFCISWVQVHGYNQHWGEGKQKELCIPPANPCVDDTYAPGCEIPPAPETWRTSEERTSPLVCEANSTGYGIVTTEARDGVTEPVWVESEWRWVMPEDWTWTDWYVTGEERVPDVQCEPIAESGGSSPLQYVAGGVILAVAGGVMVIVSRRTAYRAP